jgi:hypothetical protein
MLPLKEKDVFQGLTVTRITPSYCYFGDKCKSWNTINKAIAAGEKVILALSPNRKIDWTNKEDVVDYYNSFVMWNTYISGCSENHTEQLILDVKDGLVFHNGEYYLPCPTSTPTHWNAKQSNVKDGRFNVRLIKQENCYHAYKGKDKGNIMLNMFYPGSEIKSVSELKPNSTELYAGRYDSESGINFTYEQSYQHGTNFSLYRFDPYKLFTYYFVNKRWGDDKNVDISPSEICRIMNPIADEIEDAIRNAFQYDYFKIETGGYWGDDYVSNIMYFDERVVTKVFGIITDRINKLYPCQNIKK